ncbi:CaaX protease [Xylariaceae sp. FL0016]|nr:CaaX protease [Xylariaceae sp. FL0016]
MPSIPGFLSRYLTKEQPKPPPPITTGTAAVLLVVYTLLYVVPFYLSPTTRPSRTLSRDAPTVIRARVASVSLTCAVCSLITFLILTTSSPGGATTSQALHSLGYWPLGLVDAVRCLALTAVLFAGPLFETLIVHGAWRHWLSLAPVSVLFAEWTVWRNIVAGPFTEEVLFRSASVPLMLVAQTSVSRTIFLSPVIFGLAHVHHFYEFRLSHPHIPAATGVLRSAVQFSYTSLFGAYATFLFLRSGSLLAICVVHAFCNVMGLPRFWGRVGPGLGDDAYDDDDDDDDDDAGAGRRGGEAKGGTTPSIWWTVVYYVLLVGGAVGWYKNLGTLTESGNALVPVEI